MSVSIHNLTKIYGRQRAVDGISFQVQPGEVLGFLGPNGAGKSTTMKIATCYLPPTEGKVEVAGHDVQDAPLAVRRKVGYLPEHNPLYLDMYVHEYIQFAGSLYGLKGAALKTRVAEVVRMVGLEPEQRKRIGALSKGYRQRVGLAQALVHDPEVLILDEPTTGLDPNQLAEIRQLIKEVAREKTVIFSTHIMQEVQAICSRVIIINKGQLVADRPVAALAGTAARQRVRVLFLEPVETARLAALEGVTEVIPAGEAFEIAASGTADIRPILFQFAVANNLTLLEMQRMESSLEAVFRELTV